MISNSPTTNQIPTTKSPLVVIVGETASGKSAAAMELAKRINGEIICADSWTVYKEFDIGTSKPTAEERQQIPHHLLNVTTALEGFNVALFKSLADAAILDIGSRGKLPILVGGSGLYIDSVLFDYSFLPTVSDDERSRRNQQDLTELLAEATSRSIDLTGIDIRNKRRVIRALETNGLRPMAHDVRSNTLILGIQIDRSLLLERISKRVESMLIMGLEQEVRRLQHKYGWDVEPMRGIGYREWREYFEGTQTIIETKQRIIQSSMNLAKKQRTWFKRNKSIHYDQDSSELVSLAMKWLQTGFDE